jgi:hypothetical protein
MPLTPNEAFKTAFLVRCEEEGLAEEAILERVKAAQVLCITTSRNMEEDGISVDLEWNKSAGIGSAASSLINAISGGAKNVYGLGADLLKTVGWTVPLTTAAAGGAAGATLGYMGGSLANSFTPDVRELTTPEEVKDIQAAEKIQMLRREAAAARRRTAMLRRKRELADAKTKETGYPRIM